MKDEGYYRNLIMKNFYHFRKFSPYKLSFHRIYNKGNYSIAPGRAILVYQISRQDITSHQAFRLWNGVRFILEDSPSWNPLINGMVRWMGSWVQTIHSSFEAISRVCTMCMAQTVKNHQDILCELVNHMDELEYSESVKILNYTSTLNLWIFST